jgi:hypothetical protein
MSEFLFRKILPEEKGFSLIKIITKENLEFTNKNMKDYTRSFI